MDIDKLIQKSKKNRASLSTHDNPILSNFADNRIEDVKYTVVQYSHFSRYIVYFLILGMNRLHSSSDNLSPLKNEIRRNIQEELSWDDLTQSSGVPHYSILVKGIKELLGVNVFSEKLSPATSKFTSDISTLILSGDESEVIGGLYALEYSAHDELHMVFTSLKLFVNKHDIEIPIEIETFFCSHIGDIEVGHEKRLREAICACRKSINSESFFTGFERVLTILDQWWINLYAELECESRQTA